MRQDDAASVLDRGVKMLKPPKPQNNSLQSIDNVKRP